MQPKTSTCNPGARRRGGWTGRATLHQGRAVYLGTGTATSVHTVHALKIVVPLEDTPLHFYRGGGAWVEATSLVTPAGLHHAIDCGGGPVALLYLLPDSAGFVAMLRHVAARGPTPLPQTLGERFRAPLLRALEAESGSDVIHRIADDLVRAALPYETGAAIDRRLARALALLNEAEAPPTLPPLAERVRVSPTRLTHLFQAELGLSFKHYALALRLRRALEGRSKSASLTALAHDAGFADLAHLSRTCRRMLGVTPSDLSLD